MKKFILRLILVILIIGISYCSFRLCITSINKQQLEKDLREKQIDLAELLGVSLEEYPPAEAFPIGYFSELLVPGMSLAEVHSEMQGYEKVIHNKNLSEIYYFFYEDDTLAIRIKLKYDENGNFTKVVGEDKDSSTFYAKQYQLGQIEE